jgi:hypothetical protein
MSKLGRLGILNDELNERNMALQQENAELKAQLIEAGLMEDPAKELAEDTAEAEGPPAGHEGPPTEEEVEAATTPEFEPSADPGVGERPPEVEEAPAECCGESRQAGGPGCCDLPKAAGAE